MLSAISLVTRYCFLNVPIRLPIYCVGLPTLQAPIPGYPTSCFLRIGINHPHMISVKIADNPTAAKKVGVS